MKRRTGKGRAPATQAQMPLWLQAAVLGAVFIGVALWIAGPAIDGEFLADDFTYIVNNPYVHGFSFDNARAVLDPMGVPTLHTWNYAPAHLFAHTIEWTLFGGEATRGWHVVNAVLHGLTTLLLLALLRRSSIPTAAALFGATFFLVHPANVETVCWISQLKTLLATALSLAALLLLERRPVSATLLFTLAILTKFTAAPILAAAVVQAWVRSRDDAVSARWGWIGAWAGIFALISIPEMVAFQGQHVLRTAIEQDVLVHARSIVAFAMRYLVMATTAQGLSTFHEPEPAASLLDPWWLAGLAALVLIGARTLIVLRRRAEEAVYWVMAAAAFGPVSQVFPFTFPMADRYLYPILPGLIGGVLLAVLPHTRRLLAAVAARSEQTAAALRLGAALGAMATVVWLAAESELRAPVFASNRAMMEDATLHYPDGLQAALLTADGAARQGDARAAAAAYQRAFDRGYVDIVAMFSNPVLLSVRDAPEFQSVMLNIADRVIQQSDDREPDQTGLLHLALAYEQRGDSVRAIGLLERAILDGGPFDAGIRSVLDDLRTLHPAVAEARVLPNVLLVTVDTLRADQLGIYGFNGDSSPNIDELARSAVVFERALAASSRTAPSHASLFASRWVRDHSIGYTNGATRLGDETTLAALLADAGYDTAAFIGNSMLHRRLGLNRGFAHYDDRLPDSEANRLRFERGAEKTTLPATRWLAAPRTRPFFLWVQYNDPHGPYTPPSGYAPSAAPVDGTALPALREQHGVGGIPAYQVVGDERTPAQYQARYTGEIRYFDEWLGKLLYATERNADGRETVIVLTADHGESLGEDGIWFAHGNATTPNLVHVPLLLRAPNVAAARVSSLVHHVDVVPTLLDLIGLPPIPNAAGLSLLPLVREGKSLPERTLFSDVGNDVSAYRGDRFARLTLVEWNGETSWRLVTHQWKPDGSWAEAPAEENLEREVIEYTKHRVPTLQAPQLTPAAEAGLRALGYAD